MALNNRRDHPTLTALSRNAHTKEVSLGPSLEPHLKAIRKYIEAGFDHLILMQIGPEQDPFFEFFEHELRHTLLS